MALTLDMTLLLYN